MNLQETRSPMKNETVAGLRLFYDVKQQEAAQIIGMACERSVELLHQQWGLATPEDCRVYVMTSWLRFLFHSAPWPWKAYLALTLPLVARRASRIWPYAGGWSLQFGRRRVVGVKPLRLIQIANRRLGEQIFTQDRDLSETVQTVTCHELVHAFTFHLKLPTWLSEGLATLAMEHYLDRRIVRKDTLEKLSSPSPADNGGRTKKLRVGDPQALISQYVRGYWLTRYIEETRPELLRDLLSKPHRQKDLAEKVASTIGIDREDFWKSIDEKLQSHFR
jgi:DNA-binding phage protein